MSAFDGRRKTRVEKPRLKYIARKKMFLHSDNELTRLLQKCRDGDARAWDKLVESLSGIAYSCCRRAGLNVADAEDVFQATFIALYRNLDRVDEARALPKWIAMTCSREAVRVKRIADHTVTLPENSSLEDVMVSDESSASEVAADASSADAVREAMRQLGGRCAQLLSRLFCEEPQEYQQISAELGIPTGAIGPTRARCLEKLRKSLEEEGFFE